MRHLHQEYLTASTLGWLMLRVLALVVVGSIVLITAFFAWPHDDPPARADAVVVLEGSKTRLPLGLELVHDGYAPLLVVSRGDRKFLERRLCSGELGVRVICFVADPPSTQGEAEFIGRLAKRHGFTRLDVVTSKFHAFRARMLVRRCYHGELRMVGSSQQTWKLPWYALSEAAKAVYQAVFDRRC
jgi:uncharacterized SAM-binding protein YcdF (DUF218 family)